MRSKFMPHQLLTSVTGIVSAVIAVITRMPVLASWLDLFR